MFRNGDVHWLRIRSLFVPLDIKSGSILKWFEPRVIALSKTSGRSGCAFSMKARINLVLAEVGAQFMQQLFEGLAPFGIAASMRHKD